MAVNRAAVGPLRIFAVASPDAIRLTGRGEPGTGPVENASRCSRFRDNRMAFRRKLGRVVGVVRRGNSVAGASVSRRVRGGGKLIFAYFRLDRIPKSAAASGIPAILRRTSSTPTSTTIVVVVVYTPGTD